MKKSKLLTFIFNPPVWLIVINFILTLCCIIGSIIIINITAPIFLSYIVYAISAISLAYTTFNLIKNHKKIKNNFKQLLNKYNLTSNIINDYNYRNNVFLCISTLTNLCFAIFNSVFAIMFYSLWNITIAIYYFILCLIRGTLFISSKKIEKKYQDDKEKYLHKINIFQLCGLSIMLLEIAMSSMVTLMIFSYKPISGSSILAIGSAAYTFYKLTLSIVNIIKVKKLKDPIFQAYRNLGIIDALIALLSLQVSLIAVFSENQNDMLALNATIGFLICSVTIGISLYMIVSAYKIKKTLKENDKYGKQ